MAACCTLKEEEDDDMDKRLLYVAVSYSGRRGWERAQRRKKGILHQLQYEEI
jgi:hypothetical protein